MLWLVLFFAIQRTSPKVTKKLCVDDRRIVYVQQADWWQWRRQFMIITNAWMNYETIESVCLVWKGWSKRWDNILANHKYAYDIPFWSESIFVIEFWSIILVFVYTHQWPFNINIEMNWKFHQTSNWICKCLRLRQIFDNIYALKFWSQKQNHQTDVLLHMHEGTHR